MLADLQAYKGAGQEIRDVCLLMAVLWKQNQAKLNVFLASVLSLFIQAHSMNSSEMLLEIYLENTGYA